MIFLCLRSLYVYASHGDCPDSNLVGETNSRSRLLSSRHCSAGLFLVSGDVPTHFSLPVDATSSAQVRHQINWAPRILTRLSRKKMQLTNRSCSARLSPTGKIKAGSKPNHEQIDGDMLLKEMSALPVEQFNDGQ